MLSKYRKKVELFYNNITDVVINISNHLDKKQNKYLWIFGMVYKLIMDLYFIFAMDPIYGYLGFECNPSIINYAISWSMYILGFYWIQCAKNHVVKIFLHLQWVLIIVPVFILYGLQSKNSIVYPFIILAVVLLQVLIGNRSKNTYAIAFGKAHLNSYVTVFLCIVAVAVWAIMALWNDFAGLKAFDWDYVYEMRENLVYPPLFNYIVNWVTRAIIPWLLIIGLNERKLFLIGYSLFSQVIFFMILGHKMPLLLMAVILCVYVLAELKALLVGIYTVLIAAGAVGIVSTLLESMGNAQTNILYNAIYGMRTMFYPAMVKYQHYEMFSDYPKVFFADGMIGKFLSQTNLYANSLGVTVYAFFNNGNTDSQSNTGYLVDSFDQLGFVGMLIIGVFVVLVIKFIANYDKHIPLSMLACLIICFVVSINDNAFFTTFLTGGVWLLLILLMIYAKGERDDKL